MLFAPPVGGSVGFMLSSYLDVSFVPQYDTAKRIGWRVVHVKKQIGNCLSVFRSTA
jgi:hypothetical protein